MDEKFLEIKSATKCFGGTYALKNIDFEINKGEIHCLIGQNGCGKSTMIKIISGVYTPDDPTEIYIKGKRINRLTSTDSMHMGIQVIYQDLSVFPNLTVAENVAFFRHINEPRPGVDWKTINETAREAVDKIHVDLPLNITVDKLSIAERQLVAICRALATNAELIIMDEPTSSLTKNEIELLFKVTKELNAKGISIIFVSHKLDEVISIADRVTVLRDGEKTGTFRKDEIDAEKLTFLMSGQYINYKKAGARADNEVVLEVKNLSRSNEFRNVSFLLGRGEVLGIAGLLGSGRTELALAIFGLNKPESGQIFLEDKEISIKSNRDAIENGIVYLPEDRLLQGVVLDQSVEANITVTIMDRLVNRLKLIRRKASQKVTYDWIGRLLIKTSKIDANVSTMSGGNQQKVVIAKWLATNPKVVILDEPTNGVDVAAKSAIYDIIREFSEKGISIILISSEVPEVYYNCHRVLVMRKGELVKELLTDKISVEELGSNVI